ncbi:hypothetical protein EBR56_09010 [bacterium]|nr:hypothetical protein [bacterium]
MTERAGREQRLTVALVGNPNTGKSTLFTALAGIPTRIGNYPGVTVEEKVGRFTHRGRPIDLVDLPGTYSLRAQSPDEQVVSAVLAGTIRGLGLEWAERSLAIADLAGADEILLTSTPTCLLPAARLDGRPIGTGGPGPVFRRLLTAWSDRAGLDIAGQAGNRKLSFPPAGA